MIYASKNAPGRKKRRNARAPRARNLRVASCGGRLRAAEAALEKIEELEGEEWVRKDTAERMRNLYDYRRRRFAARYTGQPENGDEDDYEERTEAYRRFRRELLGAERAALLRLRSEGRISDGVRRRVERDLDLEETRLDI